jgi:NADPH-dependent F420 reductase
MKVGIIGGTGKLGMAFVSRFAATSHQVAIGSRDASKAGEAATSSGKPVTGMSNLDAAAWCDVAILAIPYASHRSILDPIRDRLGGKLIFDATVPINPSDFYRIETESGKSAAEETDVLVGTAFVFAAFQTISHRNLRNVDHIEDVLIAGRTDRKPEAMQLIRDINLRAIDAGPLEAARLIEHVTLLLISINKQNKIKESGLTVTGL